MRLFSRFSLIYVKEICKAKRIVNQYNNRKKKTQEIEKKKKLEKKITKL